MAQKRAAAVEEAEEGAPAWMVTFGDMMSLLLAFFVMLFAISEVKEEKFSAAVNSFQEYFNHKGGAQVSVYAEEAMVQTFKDVYIEFLKGNGDAQGARQLETQEGEEPEAHKIREGLTLTVGGVVTFDQGSAHLDVDTLGRSAVLDEISDKIRGYRFKVDVRGHAETSEASAIQDPNIDGLGTLSFRRAQVVQLYLVKFGRIRAERISATAEAAHDPVGLSAEDRMLNRRVEVVASERTVKYPGE